MAAPPPPSAPHRREPLREQPGAHFDSAPVDDSMTHGRFMVTGLIADTPASCPGFTLWPGSAPRLYTLALEIRKAGHLTPTRRSPG